MLFYISGSRFIVDVENSENYDGVRFMNTSSHAKIKKYKNESKCP